MADDEILQATKVSLDRGYPDERRLAALQKHGEDPRLLKEAAEQGWFGLIVPEPEDGLGLAPARLVPIFQLFGQHLVTGPLMKQMLLPGLLPRTARDGSVRSRLTAAVAGAARVAVLDPGATLNWRLGNGSLALRSARNRNHTPTGRFLSNGRFQVEGALHNPSAVGRPPRRHAIAAGGI